MKMASFEVQRRVAAPAERVWAVIANYARDREWRTGVEMRQDPPGPAVAGAITHEKLRFLGSEMRVIARVEQVQEGRRLTFRTLESDVPVQGERCVTPLGNDASQVAMRMEMSLTGVRAFLAAPLTALFRWRVAGDLARLAALVEAPEPS